MKKVLVVVAVLTVAVTLSAADYFYPRFTPHRTDFLAKPCGLHGGLMGPGSETYDSDEHVTLTLWTCNDGTPEQWTDQRPGSGTSVGATSSAIKVQLDAPTGTVHRGTVVAGGGWAFECGHTMTTVQVKVNGAIVIDNHETIWGVRPDVISAYGPCASTAGYNFTLDTSAFGVGTYQVQVEVVDDQGQNNVSNTLTLALVP